MTAEPALPDSLAPTTIALAARLKAERASRGWSLAELAARTGVSRAMISKIERGEASPTAELLGRLAAGFNITLASLFTTPQAVAGPLKRRADQTEWRDPATGYLRRAVNAAFGAGDVEIVEVEFPARARVFFDNLRPSDVEQCVWVLDGTLDMTVGEVTHRLERGDSLSMRLDRPLVFANPTDRAIRYVVVLSKGRPQ